LAFGYSRELLSVRTWKPWGCCPTSRCSRTGLRPAAERQYRCTDEWLVKTVVARQWQLVGILGAMSLACVHGGSRAAARSYNPAMVELADVWAGRKQSCSAGHDSSQPVVQRWNCSAPGWESVTLTVQGNDPSSRSLRAHGKDLALCELGGPSEDVVVVDEMEGKIVSGWTVAVKGGVFAGTCVSVESYYTGSGCYVSVYPTDKRLSGRPSNQELQRTGCARR
jgi:hypothetical protein